MDGTDSPAQLTCAVPVQYSAVSIGTKATWDREKGFLW
jgi:hypothetical protein